MRKFSVAIFVSRCSLVHNLSTQILSFSRNNQHLSCKFVLAVAILSMFTIQSSFAQKHIEYSVYGGLGILNIGGDQHDEKIEDGYDFSAKPIITLGGEVKFSLSKEINTFFVKPALEFNRYKYSYEKSSSKMSEETGSYLNGRKLVKYETTRYSSSYDNRKTEGYNVTIPVTLGYQFAFGAKTQYRMSVGALGLVGLPIHTKATIEDGWTISYSPFYENGGKKVFHKVTDKDNSVTKTNDDIDFDNCTYGFGGQVSFYYWKLNAQYSFRYEKAFSGDSNAYNMSHIFTIGYVF